MTIILSSSMLDTQLSHQITAFEKYKVQNLRNRLFLKEAKTSKARKRPGKLMGNGSELLLSTGAWGQSSELLGLWTEIFLNISKFWLAQVILDWFQWSRAKSGPNPTWPPLRSGSLFLCCTVTPKWISWHQPAPKHPYRHPCHTILPHWSLVWKTP